LAVRRRNKLRLKAFARRAAREPDLTSLINIVFLILIFFIVAGTLRPFSSRDIELVKISKEAAAASVPGRLVIHQDGSIQVSGKNLTLPELAGAIAAGWRPSFGKPYTMVVDGRAPGSKILEVSRALQAAGIKDISVMVERGRK
jgi:biopolymer transport protein ExbD